MKKMKNPAIFFYLLLIIPLCSFANTKNDTIDNDAIKETIKTGWTFGGVPALAFDTDVGITYGGVVNFYYYGNGTTYPKYIHSLYMEVSRTTKGSGINQLIFDSDSLIKGLRTFVEFSYLTESLLDFYGFNGLKAHYNPEKVDVDGSNYLSRLYYRQERQLLRIRTDLVGDIKGSDFNWFGGFEYANIKLDTIDLGKVNEGKDLEDFVPASEGGLYGKYREWGLIPEDQFNGGTTSFLKGGLSYDTRDNEANPNKGMWTEAQLLWAPGFIGNEYTFSKLVLIHRHYITLVPKKMTFAYRLSYQGKIAGEIPTYMLPFIYNSPPSLTRDGMGGKKTIRGAMRNRIVGEDYLFGNFELRFKTFQRVIFKQNIYVGWSLFFDSGIITKGYQLKDSTDPEAITYLNKGADNDGLHNGVGIGMHPVLNDNFILSFDYGIPLRKEDGTQGFYMGLNYLF